MRLPLAHPSMQPYLRYMEKPGEAPDGAVTARFLGTSSLLLQDGTTTVLSDGFVTRPSMARTMAGTIKPDRDVITRAINRLDITTMSAVFCCHSHYDHALDAPIWAERTGAELLGSQSTANVGRGLGLPESALRVVGDGDTLTYGDFKLTFLESVHSPGDHYPGTIDQPLVPPAKAGAWKTGSAYSVLITHRDKTLLLHASANFRPGSLQGRRADVVYLGMGTLGKQSDEFADQYWKEVVRATGARRVILVHWDDFFRSLDKPLRPMRDQIEDFDRGMQHILTRAQADNVEVLLPASWQKTAPFAS